MEDDMTDLIGLLAADLGLPEQDVRTALVKLLMPQVLAVIEADAERAERAAMLDDRERRDGLRARARTKLRRWL
jgi:hypothetical protein